MAQQHTQTAGSGIQIKATDKRIGRFTVRDEILRNSINTGLAARLFYGCVPLDVQRDWMQQESTFVLWHASFDAIDESKLIPEYIALVENGAITWERVEHNDGNAAAFGAEKLDQLLSQRPSLKTTEVAA